VERDAADEPHREEPIELEEELQEDEDEDAPLDRDELDEARKYFDKDADS
jgi:hypothetical protein